MSFDFKKDPIDNFLSLYKEAQIRGVPEAQAMSLATVNDQNQPSVRIVYFKGIFESQGNRGLSFYTNYNGRKGHDMEANKKVSANFFWPHLDRQVRFEAYFATRARLSQAGAWASAQSEKIESYDNLLNKISEIEKKYQGQKIPCPPHWGGYSLVPTEIEFWFGKNGRLHERYVYEKNGSAWNKFLRSP
jgi:pyridoxamine 5'-phosphate oxidase